MRHKHLALCAALAAFLSPTRHVTAAPAEPASVVIMSDGGKGASIAVPRDRTVRVRLEGRDRAGRVVPLDPARIVWRAPKGRSFDSRTEGGYAFVTAERDAFDTSDGDEPSGMITAKYGALSAAVVVDAVLNVEGTWRLFVTGDVVDMNLRQSGRWIKDDQGRTGTINGRRLDLKVTEKIRVIGIPTTLTLYPRINFTSREAGTGTVDVPFGTETLRVQKIR